jgi:hypothetical protein
MKRELDGDGYDEEEPPKRVIGTKGFSLFIWLNTHPKWIKNHRNWILQNIPDEKELDKSEDE